MNWKGFDTEYGGILYRSRLEARWAKYLDDINIRHKYEFETFYFGNQKYTPDFWLPDHEIYLEIKSYKSFKKRDALWKCFSLAVESRLPVLLVKGYPKNHLIDWYGHGERRHFSFGTKVIDSDVKPVMDGFRFSPNRAIDGEVLLEHLATGEDYPFFKAR